MQRYFIEPQADYRTAAIELTGEVAHHIVHVMRMKVGESVMLSYREGPSFEAVLRQITATRVVAQWVCDEQQSKELPIHVTIANGLLKGDKFDWLVQKATELGMQQLIPLQTERCVVQWDAQKGYKKINRLQKIAGQAAEQAHRQQIPTITQATTLTQLCLQFSQYDCVLIAYEEAVKGQSNSVLRTSYQKLEKGMRLLVLFGPEGGFSSAEVACCRDAGAIVCGLGPCILRAETVPLYVLSALSFYTEL